MVFIIGLPVSWITRKENEIVDRDLISPPFQWAAPKTKDSDYFSIEKGLKIISVHSEDEQKQ